MFEKSKSGDALEGDMSCAAHQHSQCCYTHFLFGENKACCHSSLNVNVNKGVFHLSPNFRS